MSTLMDAPVLTQFGTSLASVLRNFFKLSPPDALYRRIALQKVQAAFEAIPKTYASAICKGPKSHCPQAVTGERNNVHLRIMSIMPDSEWQQADPALPGTLIANCALGAAVVSSCSLTCSWLE